MSSPPCAERKRDAVMTGREDMETRGFVDLTMFTSLQEAVSTALGEDVRIAAVAGVSGGDINRAYRLTASDGTNLFMKCNTKANLPFFTAEAEGLEAIARTGAIRTHRCLVSERMDGMARFCCWNG